MQTKNTTGLTRDPFASPRSGFFPGGDRQIHLEHLRHLRQEEQMLASNEASLSSRDAKRLDQLRKDIAECEAYDLELKDVADRQIAFDLDDGVTENHKLFGNVVAKIK